MEKKNNCSHYKVIASITQGIFHIEKKIDLMNPIISLKASVCETKKVVKKVVQTPQSLVFSDVFVSQSH